MNWILLHPKATLATLGFIPSFLNEDDLRPAKKQFDTAYRHGGGWDPFEGFQMTAQGLAYPNDPPMRPVAETVLHDKETIRVYECSWVAIIQKDGSFEVCRMD